ncbi:FlhC family transcriptional regulator [Hydrogenophaga sp. NFH-34]|uniref:FlhC family transcriptional regulator n=1 Tax=Hydrogenophaga sp. NFH-34 TaxID=2744446 RepID=UPI001F263B2B|nr:FlhC family transcriptional regulator [Hydrogenophaga sp. NFH-34]
MSPGLLNDANTAQAAKVPGDSLRSPKKLKRTKTELAAMYQCVRLMVQMNARACVITQLTGLPSLEVRDLWQQIAGRSSPSGQQPNDLNWYLKTPTRRYHSALIVQLYVRALRTMPEYAALTHAYYHYGRITGSMVSRGVWQERGDPAFRASEKDYEISFARAHFICKSYSDELLSTGQRKCTLKIKRCQKGECGGMYMSTENEAGRYCPLCTG